MGHVNHARYLSYFEDARMTLLATSPAGLAGADGDRGYIAARVAVDYQFPATFRPGLMLRVETRISRIGTTSWTFDQRMYDGDGADRPMRVRTGRLLVRGAQAATAGRRRAGVLGGSPVKRFVYDCPVRWSDMDAYGHINNVRFLTYYEEARVALMFIGARDAGVTSLEAGIVIFRHEVDYLRPVDYGVPVRIEMWIEELRPSPVHRRVRVVRR